MLWFVQWLARLVPVFRWRRASRRLGCKRQGRGTSESLFPVAKINLDPVMFNGLVVGKGYWKLGIFSLILEVLLYKTAVGHSVQREDNAK